MSAVDPGDPGRNLLLGLLAFQNQFIDRSALLGAFDAWTADRSRPLGVILRDRGAISARASAYRKSLEFLGLRNAKRAILPEFSVSVSVNRG